MLESFIEVTGPVASTFVVGAAAGEMMVPLLMAYFMQQREPQSFMYIEVAICSLATAVYLAMYVYGSQGKQRQLSKMSLSQVNKISIAG